MSVPVNILKQFVENDYKDNTILIITDNEHRYYHRANGNPSVIWDWNNNVFYALESNEEATDQSGHPMQLTVVSFDEIQFLTVYIDTKEALSFINTKYTDEKEKENAKEVLQKIRPSQMGPKTLRQFGRNEDGSDRNM